MKKMKPLSLIVALTILLTACGTAQTQPENSPSVPGGSAVDTYPIESDVTEIHLSDDKILVDGAPAETDVSAAVYTANDIIYYESGKDFTYGEGTEADAHTAEEASAHTVVHITQPGAYRISGTLSRGQIAVDLGDNAEENPNAAVTLILNGLDLTCEVAPAVIFYRVYECGSDDADIVSKDVDTSSAGANVIIADGTVNTVNGSYVARIYKPGSVVLNEAGTGVEDAKKLHKYDAAFYSKVSMNVSGGKQGTGILNINAENEGLDSELHLTINSGNINITSGNDGINTNEDGVSVTTVNGGTLTIKVTGETGEGDGIDSNGWLVINGGTIIAAACSNSADAGIDSDMGIHINGGTVMATGHMLDQIENGGQTYVVFTFAQQQSGNNAISLKTEEGDIVMDILPSNSYSILVYSSPELTPGTYTLWSDDTQLAGQSGMGGMPNMQHGDKNPPEQPDGMTPPEGITPPEGMTPPEGEPPAEGQRPNRPDGQDGGGRRPNGTGGTAQESTTQFIISNGANMFGNITKTP